MQGERETTTQQRKRAIIDYLIKNHETTTTEFITNSPEISSKKNPSAALTIPLRQLHEEGIIAKKHGIEHKEGTIGAIPLTLKINKNLKTIRDIFNLYPSLRTNLYHSDWIREIIVNYRIKIPLSNKSREELKRYLRASPSFFQYCLTHNKIDEIAYEWHLHVFRNEADYKECLRLFRERNVKIPEKMYHEFFYVCAFIDKMNGVITKEAQIYLKTYQRITER